MTCNDAFCGLCAGVSGVPATEDAEQDLHDVPFVHSNALDYTNASRREDDELWSVFFKGHEDNDLGSVLPAAACFLQKHAILTSAMLLSLMDASVSCLSATLSTARSVQWCLSEFD